MKAREALRALAEITEPQWGLVTSAQALAAGLASMDLTRLTQSGDLVRVAHGVYRDAGAPADQHEDLRAIWLSTDPARLAHQRLRDRHPGAVISGESAAELHTIGNFRAEEVEISLPQRRRSRREGARFKVREIEPSDTTLIEGLPVTSLERTIADLTHDGHDLSHVADAMGDALRQTELDDDRLAVLLSPSARSRGFAPGDGRSLLQKLKEVAGTGEGPLADVLWSRPLIGRLMLETTKALANSPDFARATLRETRRSELPRLLHSVTPAEALEPRQSEVDQLMESAARMLGALTGQQAEMAARLLEASKVDSPQQLARQLRLLKANPPNASDEEKSDSA